jgi:hypothetical protein
MAETRELKKELKKMGMAIDTTTMRYVQDTSASEPVQTREQRIAYALVRMYGKKGCYVHAQNMIRMGGYEKQGINAKEVISELNKLTKKQKTD